jgi:tetratricopeptide (TPR) repeat protein
LNPLTRHPETTHAAPLPLPLAPLLLLPLLLVTGLALLAGGCRRKGGRAFNQGQAHFKKKQFAKAIVSFKKAVKQNPAFGEAHYNLGAARYQLAAVRLNALVKQHGSPALKAALKATVGKKPVAARMHTSEHKAILNTLITELRLLPAGSADPIVTLLRQALSSKLKARALFEKGKFVVVDKSSTRRSMLSKLHRLVQLRAILRKKGETDRGLWLLAVARPALLTERAKKTGRPRPQNEKKP